VISLKIKDVAYIVKNNKPKHLTATKMEYTRDNSELEKINDPIKAETETRIIKGKRKQFLTILTELFSESIVSHAFTGFRIIFFIP
jgi:hypothetical protein